MQAESAFAVAQSEAAAASAAVARAPSAVAPAPPYTSTHMTLLRLTPVE